MPIAGADGSDGRVPTKLTEGIAWDMQPRFSPDGKWIAFTSDRTGKSERGGDNIWVMRSDGSDAKQVTNETFQLLNGPAWSPDGQYIVARSTSLAVVRSVQAKCGCTIAGRRCERNEWCAVDQAAQ